MFSQSLRSQVKESDKYTEVYKVIVVGDSTVGKTHLISQYVKGALPNDPTATVGVDLALRLVPLQIGGTVKAMIWDTAGQEHYRSLSRAHFRSAVGALLVYDITARKTFQNAADWLDDLRTSSEPDIVVMLVGNKVDCVKNEPNLRQVGYTEAAQFAESNDMLFCEASAIQNTNVKELFEKLMQEVYHKQSRRKFNNLGEEYPDVESFEYQKTSGLQLVRQSGKSINNGNFGVTNLSETTKGMGCCSM